MPQPRGPFASASDAWCPPGMGVNLQGVSPLCVTSVKSCCPRAGSQGLQLLLVDTRHLVRRVSIPEHLICQVIERSYILLCEATVKCLVSGKELWGKVRYPAISR